MFYYLGKNIWNKIVILWVWNIFELQIKRIHVIVRFWTPYQCTAEQSNKCCRKWWVKGKKELEKEKKGKHQVKVLFFKCGLSYAINCFFLLRLALSYLTKFCGFLDFRLSIALHLKGFEDYVESCIFSSRFIMKETYFPFSVHCRYQEYNVTVFCFCFFLTNH